MKRLKALFNTPCERKFCMGKNTLAALQRSLGVKQKMIKVDEKKLDSLLKNSLISCHGLYLDSSERDCNLGYTKTLLGKVRIICQNCKFRDKEAIKEWLKEE